MSFLLKSNYDWWVCARTTLKPSLVVLRRFVCAGPDLGQRVYLPRIVFQRSRLHELDARLLDRPRAAGPGQLAALDVVAILGLRHPFRIHVRAVGPGPDRGLRRSAR